MTPLIELVIDTIQQRFAGVRLGNGISLKQAEVIDRYGEGCTDEEFAQLKETEMVDDWQLLPLSELDRDNVAHLDGEGYRYYLPALMLSVIHHYEPASMRVIGTLLSLHPKKENWNYSMLQYAFLNAAQKHAVALFLLSLPNLVSLDANDQVLVERALRNYWSEFLEREIPLWLPTQR